MSILLRVNQVCKHFAAVRGGTPVKAVDGVSFELYHNEVFALIGESGSGKSTLAELIVGLQQPTSGTLDWAEQPNISLTDSPTSRIQVVFQNPDRSMNPYWRVKDIVAEPLRLSGVSKAKAMQKVSELLARVKLSDDFMERYPAECSGGQKQRIAIARALSMSPRLLVADEITSALDPSIEEEILLLLLELKRADDMAILYITHRLETIAGFADRVAVIKDGKIQEIGNTMAVLANPTSAYTKALLAAATFT